MENQKLTLGVDLGLTSLGIAIIDPKDKKIVHTAVINTSSVSDSDNKTRRGMRLRRRQLRRKNRRIRQIYHLLIEEGILPISTVGLRKNLRYVALIDDRKDRYNNRPKGRKHKPENDDQIYLNKFLKNTKDRDPYILRKRAIQGDEITLEDWARILVHFAHRRGFPEKHLRLLENNQEKKDGAQVLKNGKPEEHKIGANETQEAIEKAAHPYLGYMLAERMEKRNEGDYLHERVRNRFTYRLMYEQEFDHIWQVQQNEKRHPEVFNKQDLKAKIKDILFDQLPLAPVNRGKCTFENHGSGDGKYHKPRARRCDLLFEEYRMHQWVNGFMQTLKKEGHDTTDTTRDDILKFYQNRKKFKIEALKKHLGVTSPCTEYEKEHEIPTIPVIKSLQDLFGKPVWATLSEKEQRNRWHIIFQQHDAAPDKLKAYAEKKWQLNEKQLDKLDKIKWGKETANISVRAIRYILPYLEKGHTYDKAVILGTIPKAFGHRWGTPKKGVNKPNHWMELSKEEQDNIIQKAEKIIESTQEKPLEAIKTYLCRQYPHKAYAPDHIYHHAYMKDVALQNQLTNFEPTRNPMVDRALYALRRHLNPIMKDLNIQQFDKIRVEMARELKKSEENRNKLVIQQARQQQENQAACAWLLQNDYNTSSANIKKYRLWKEAGFTCVYTGQHGANMFRDAEIEHIRPVTPKDSRWCNLTIASKQGNAEKAKRTPYEAFGGIEKRWYEIKKRAKKHFSPAKYQHFISKAPLEKTQRDFTQREANLTGYITKAAVGYLKQVSEKVEVTQGGVVSQLRNAWKFNRLLAPALPFPKGLDETKYDDGQYWVAYQEEMNFIPGEPRILPYRNVLDIEPFKPTAETVALVQETTTLKKETFDKMSQTIGDLNNLYQAQFDFEAEITRLKDVIAGIDARIKKCETQKKHLNAQKKKPQQLLLFHDANDEITRITDVKVLHEKIKALKTEKKPYFTQLSAAYKTRNATKKEVETGVKNLEKAQLATFESRVGKQLKADKAKNKKFHIIPTELITIKSKNEGESNRRCFVQKGKNRDDHRHHLIDACVIATTKNQYTQYANYKSGKGENHQNDVFPAPWTGFKESVKAELCKAIVSHRTKRGLLETTKKWGLVPKYPTPGDRTPAKRYQHIKTGGTTARTKLYQETYYGCYKNKKGEVCYHHRVAIEKIETLKQAKKIVDKTVQELVKQRLEDTKAYNEQAKKEDKKHPFWDIKKEVIDKDKKIVSKTPTLFLTKDGFYAPGATPIKKVRIYKKFSNAVIPKLASNTNRWVDPGNNWSAGIYQDKSGAWYNKIVTALEAAHMMQKNKPCPPEKYSEKFHRAYPLVFTLQINNLVVFTSDFDGTDPTKIPMTELSPYIYRVQAITTTKGGQYTFRRHTAATLKNKLEGKSLTINSLQKAGPIKIEMDKVGQIARFILPKQAKHD